jgi:hypothetical protein
MKPMGLLAASILLLIVSLSPSAVPSLFLQTEGLTSLMDDVSFSLSQDTDAPYLDNYLKKFSYGIYVDVLLLDLKIIANDSDGIHLVILKYKQIGNTEYRNKIMNSSESIDGEYQTTLELKLGDATSQYRVRYFANDTLGNEIITDEFVYDIFQSPPGTADASVDVYDTPDLTYQVGTTGNYLHWALSSTGGDTGCYSLFKDGYPIEMAPITTQLIETNVDGLRLGIYRYELIAQGSFGSGSDTAMVTVVEETPSSTSSTTSQNDLSDFSYVPFLAGVITSVVVLFLIIKRRMTD